ncbi:MAG TPA: GNAT family N-acetyltransferase [Flavobacteriaceae bacterium]|nr:GNAT family N-acetyltransferase [Flavobacteriaceae bacterium]HBS11670.1 GNAT family N-acetyltransferase [Flavobacteriaceae bacterium]
MEIFVETDRLILREIVQTDLEAMFDLDSDPEVHKYLGNKPFKTIEESQKYIDSLQQQYIERGIGKWAVIHKETQQFMSWSGLKLNIEEPMNGFTNYYDVGYRLMKRFWGKGYATESGIAALQYAFETMKLKTIYGITEMGNQASHNALLKIGLYFVEDFFYE